MSTAAGGLKASLGWSTLRPHVMGQTVSASEDLGGMQRAIVFFYLKTAG